MDAEQTLSIGFVETHPAHVAGILESASIEDAVALLGQCPVESVVAILERMNASASARCLTAWPDDSVASLLAALPATSVTRLLRRMGEADTRRMLTLVEPEAAKTLEHSLRFPAGTVGSLMDPFAFTLREDVGAGDAQQRIRRDGDHVRNDVYVVDRSQILSGVLTLRDLMLASPDQPLLKIMRPARQRLEASISLAIAVHHPGWGRVDALPVVDGDNRVVGVLERDALATIGTETAVTTDPGPSAIGIGVAHLLWSASSSLLDSLLSVSSRRR